MLVCVVPRGFLATAEALDRADSIVRANEEGFIAAVEAI